MKLGVIARADDRGLGNQTWEVVRHLDPERVLVVREPGSEQQGFEPHLDRFPGALVVTDNAGRLPEAEAREWLDGLDVVYSAETFYDLRFCDWAREAGVATVCHMNAEFYRPERPAHTPTAWWAPTCWRIEHLPDNTSVVPMPVPLDRWPESNTVDGLRVLHSCGRLASRDRNGTELVVQVARQMPHVEFTIASQTHLVAGRKLRNLTHTTPSPDYWDVYRNHTAMLLPRRYGGLCLPANEAAGAGLAIVMPDVYPNNWWPILPVGAERNPAPLHLGPLQIDCYDTDVAEMVAAIDELSDPTNLTLACARSRAWAEAHSWDALADQWRAELNKVAE